MLGTGDPEPVGMFHFDLSPGIVAAKRLVRGLPRSCITGTFLAVGARVDGTQVPWIVREVTTRLFIKLLGTFGPGVGKRDDVIDFNLTITARELDNFTGVRPFKSSRLDEAPVRPLPDHRINQVATQNIVARVATVSAKLHSDVIAPRLPEQLSVISRHGSTALNVKLAEHLTVAFHGMSGGFIGLLRRRRQFGQFLRERVEKFTASWHVSESDQQRKPANYQCA